jgi:hypothetical protein
MTRQVQHLSHILKGHSKPATVGRIGNPFYSSVSASYFTATLALV